MMDGVWNPGFVVGCEAVNLELVVTKEVQNQNVDVASQSSGALVNLRTPKGPKVVIDICRLPIHCLNPLDCIMTLLPVSFITDTVISLL